MYISNGFRRAVAGHGRTYFCRQARQWTHITFPVLIFGLFLLAPVALPWSAPSAAAINGAVASCAPAGPVIKVTVSGLSPVAGTLVADLHGDNPADFLKKGKKIKRVRTPVHHSTITFCIPVSAPGTYALAVYHDRNANRKFDKNWLGIPTEPFGVSNNPRFRFGPPKFRDAAFRVGGHGVSLVVALHE